MNTSKKIIFYSVAVSGIIGIWLMPGINQAKETRYVRRFEDTDRGSLEIASNPVINKVETDTTAKKRRKVYKKESIQPSRTKKVSAKMFSRAIQFEPVAGDSVENVGEGEVTAKKFK